MIEELKAWAGVKLNGLSLNIDICNYCCLRCPSCGVGSIGGRKPGLMSLEFFRRILNKAQSETKIRHVMMYVYSDPCLHPELASFVRECTERGIKTWLSTMLQTMKCDMAEVIQARPTEFRISMPGWSKMSYYQGGAIPEIFDRNFKEVVKLPRHKETTWTLCYHVYRDNQGEELERARKLAEDNGLKFVALPSIFMPLEKIVDKHYSVKDYQLLARLLETPDEAISRMKFSTTYCYLWKQITIDAFGMVYLCQLIYEDRFKLMPFLDFPLEEIQKAMRGHSFCQKCMKSGAHQYEACYADFTKYKDPVGEANSKRMK